MNRIQLPSHVVMARLFIDQNLFLGSHTFWYWKQNRIFSHQLLSHLMRSPYITHLTTHTCKTIVCLHQQIHIPPRKVSTIFYPIWSDMIELRLLDEEYTLRLTSTIERLGPLKMVPRRRGIWLLRFAPSSVRCLIFVEENTTGIGKDPWFLQRGRMLWLRVEDGVWRLQNVKARGITMSWYA